MKMPVKKIFIHVVLSLVIGLAIYIFFRQGTWLHRNILPGHTRSFIQIADSFWGNILKYNLPDFCWSYSFSSALFIWGKWRGGQIKLFVFFVFLLILAAEPLQLLLPSRFTFDWMDMVAALLAVLLSFLLVFSKWQKINS